MTDIATPNGDFTYSMREVTGSREILQACVRRLSTPSGDVKTYRDGSLLNSPNYGFDLADAVNTAADSRSLVTWAHQIASQLEEDERIETADVVGSIVGRDLQFDISVVASTGPFTFTLSINDVTVELLRSTI